MKIFLTGVYRSGTTLLSQMLRQSREIAFTYDTVQFMRFGFQRYGKGAISLENALQLGRDFNQRLESRFNQRFNFKEYDKRVRDFQPITYAKLYNAIMELYLGNKNWGEKTVLEWRTAPDIFSMFDDIYIIHIIRDPRDVLASFKLYTTAPGKDYLDAVGNCYDAMKFGIHNAKKYPQRYCLLRYEDLVECPAREMKKICQFCGLRFVPEMLQTEKFKSKLYPDKAWVANTAFSDKVEKISKAPIGRWKKHLSREELFLCEMVNNHLMAKFNYKESGKKWDINDVFQSLSLLYQSPLTLSGIFNIIHFGEGVQRYPLDPLNPKNWSKGPESFYPKYEQSKKKNILE